MGNLQWLRIAFVATVITGTQSFGEVEPPALKWGGFASLREGQIVKGEQETVVKLAENIKSDHVWIQEMNAGLTLETKFENIATGNIGFEVAMNSDNTAAPQDLGQTRRLNYYFSLSKADLLFNLRDDDAAKLEVDIGYFQYKYNSSVRNLGEYLFRSGTYPQYLITEIDFPQAKLLGLRLGGSLRNIFNFDIMLTSNTEWNAINDFNLSGIFAWKPHPVIELGVGGCWNSLFSVDLDKTTPVDTAGAGDKYIAVKKGTTDTLTYNYTFAGQKLMGRFTLDIKQLFPGVEVFGEEDLKLYGEGAILGLIDYPLSLDSTTRYDNIWERIPVMVGFNIPTFKLLDVLNLEVEYFKNPYVNSTNSIRFDNQPVPLSVFKNESNKIYMNQHDDDWKWSVYAKRTFAEHFFIMGQAARDHIRWYRLDYTKADGKEALRKKDQWYWTLKFGYNF